MSLKDLNKLAIEAQEKSDQYDGSEFVLSPQFKEKFNKAFPNYGIEFGEFTAVVTTKGSNLKIVIPNQWFAIGSFFGEFVAALKEYKKEADKLGINTPIAKQLRDQKALDSNTEKGIKMLFSDPDDQSKFTMFLTDYSWWAGSKTIERSDYFVSPVLNLARVVNVTQTYIADLAYVFSDHPELVEIIESDLNNHLTSIATNKSSDTKMVVSEADLKNFAFKSFKFLLDTYGHKKITENLTEKESSINSNEYTGLKLNHYFGSKNLIGVFDTEQTKSELSSSNTQRFFDEDLKIPEYPFSYLTTQWMDVEGDGQLSFNNFQRFVADLSNNNFEAVKTGDDYILLQHEISINKTIQKIYYGAPGTGKSYTIEKILADIPENQKERVTFHPEYDHSSFVGGYKPITEKDSITGTEEVKYKFVPQVFTNIYIKAWQNPFKDYYLAIEEINRGNCAEIFGDLFQLLDRNSNYSISPSEELRAYLESKLTEPKSIKGILGGKIKLPPNLHLLASMNTSDQSLFPMDSAFKRRWDWEYIPICYDPKDDFKNKNDSYDYEIDIEDGQKYSWIKFIEKINLNHIKINQSLGMDKCIGNYFIKPENANTISLHPFINKVIFYLWNDVFKDEDNNVFEKNTSYEDFFPIKINGKEKIKELFERIELNPIKSLEISEEPLLEAAENIDPIPN